MKSHGSEPEAWLQRVRYLFGFRKTWDGAQPVEEAIQSTDYENQLISASPLDGKIHSHCAKEHDNEKRCEKRLTLRMSSQPKTRAK